MNFASIRSFHAQRSGPEKARPNFSATADFRRRFNLPIYFQPVEWRNAPESTISPLRCLVQDPIDMIRIRLRDVFDRD